MSKKCDKKKQIRVEDNLYRQLAALQRQSAFKVAISDLGNRAIDLGLPALSKLVSSGGK